MTRIDESALVELAGELVRRPSENPPGREAAVARYLVERLESSPVPFDVESYDVEPERPNVVARAGDPEEGTILLTGHMDVVPATPEDWTGDPFELRRDGDRIVGRGVADMKGALAAEVIAAEEYLSEAQVPGEVVLAFVVDEEWNGIGTEALVERGIDADGAIIGEPTDLDVCVAEKGVVRYRITVRGRSAHSGRPDAGMNAIDGLRCILDRVDALAEVRQAETHHDLLTPDTITTTEIEGGTAPNVVPDRAAATVDWRFLPGADTSPDGFERRLDEAIAGVELGDVRVEYELTQLAFARAADIPADHELVQEVVRAAADIGLSSAPRGFNAATDARFLVHDAGIPTVIFGPGSIQSDAHTVDESVAVADLVDCARTYKRALHRVLG